MHGNNKSDEELRAAAEAGALVVLDALDEPGRAADAGVRRVMVRVTPGVEAETHESIRTGHRGSKFGLDEDDAVEAVRASLAAGLDVEGLHVHVGSQLADVRAHLLAITLLAQFADRCRTELDWLPRTIDVGGGFGIRHVEAEPEPAVEELVRTVAAAVSREWLTRGLDAPRLIVEPGRALVGPTAFTLYRVGAVKQAGDRRYVAIDGGMSDNPRPQLYQARYTAVLANRADERARRRLHDRGQALRVGRRADRPRRATRAASRRPDRRSRHRRLHARDGVQLQRRPAAGGGPVGGSDVRLIRRRETVDDLLAREVE